MNWALVGTGGITNRFLKGLFAAQGAKPYAIVSRTQANADGFAAKYGLEKAYSDYAAMLNDRAVDVVYIGTPHPTHKDLAIKALRAKKAVLCEKPACMNAAELAEIIAEAQANKTFFMEAMWTRFVPPLVKVREWLRDGLIGEVRLVQANFCFAAPMNREGRLYNRALGGGALLDAGVYPISLASMVFGGRQPEKIASMAYMGETGVDEEISALLSYGGPRMAHVSAALSTATQNDACIYGTQGRIQLPDFVFAHSAALTLYGCYTYNYAPDFISNGYNYEAEEAQRCIERGALESEVMSHAESLTIMRVIDQCRAQSMT
jgi:predicted dehydrogenase